jgi:hypothetical protein
MRLPVTAHSSRPWLIHSLTQGFRLRWKLGAAAAANHFREEAIG